MKFKVGDRVAIYSVGLRHTGIVTWAFPDGTVKVTNAGTSWTCHPKQCRRLVKRKRTEWDGEWDTVSTLASYPSNGGVIVFVPHTGTVPNPGDRMTLIEKPKRRGHK